MSTPTPVSLKLVTDAVVASYIHEISTRHRPQDPPNEDRTGESADESVSLPAAA